MDATLALAIFAIAILGFFWFIGGWEGAVGLLASLAVIAALGLAANLIGWQTTKCIYYAVLGGLFGYGIAKSRNSQ